MQSLCQFEFHNLNIVVKKSSEKSNDPYENKKLQIPEQRKYCDTEARVSEHSACGYSIDEENVMAGTKFDQTSTENLGSILKFDESPINSTKMQQQQIPLSPMLKPNDTKKHQKSKFLVQSKKYNDSMSMSSSVSKASKYSKRIFKKAACHT